MQPQEVGRKSRDKEVRKVQRKLPQILLDY